MLKIDRTAENHQDVTFAISCVLSVDPFSYPCTRSFDAQKGEHPFRYVVESWQPSLVDPLSTWLKEVTENDDYVPDWSKLNLMPVSRMNLTSIRVEANAEHVPQSRSDSAPEALLCISFLQR